MKIELPFELDEYVYFMHNNKVEGAKIQALHIESRMKGQGFPYEPIVIVMETSVEVNFAVDSRCLVLKPEQVFKTKVDLLASL